MCSNPFHTSAGPQVGNEGYTTCFNAIVQYGHGNLRLHNISLWQANASTISEMALDSDTHADGVKVPPYVVI